MIAAFATLAFLTAIWLCAVMIAGTLEQSGSKMMTALKGRLMLAAPAVPPIRGRINQRYPSPQRPVRARVAQRAAA